MKVIACIEDPVVIPKILNHLKEKGEYAGCVSIARESRPAANALILGKENPFVNHKDVAGDTRQRWRTAAGSDWADHNAEIRPV